MSPASWPRPRALEERLLHIDPATGRLTDSRVGDLGRWLRAGDVLVVNDAATLPASLRARHGCVELEVRWVRRQSARLWSAILFGEGDWRTPTERRAPPPVVAPGDSLELGPPGSGWRARVAGVSPLSPRWVDLKLEGSESELIARTYRYASPIQYSYLERDLELWSVQSAFSSRPWALEMPSAGRPLRWELLIDLKRRGVELAALTHAAGISSTGDERLDRELPLPERYEIPPETVAKITRARERGGRVIAVGTSVVRALESSVTRSGGLPAAGPGEAVLVIGRGAGADFRPRVVDGILSGMHEDQESHFDLLAAFAPREVLAQATRHADRAGYLKHEFGDSCLVLGSNQ